MKRALLVGSLLLLVLMLAGCAAGPNGMEGAADADGHLAGFWMGLWHGFIIFFSFIISLFNDAVQVYEVHNNGGWYNFGFILGASAFFGGGGKASCGRK